MAELTIYLSDKVKRFIDKENVVDRMHLDFNKAFDFHEPFVDQVKKHRQQVRLQCLQETTGSLMTDNWSLSISPVKSPFLFTTHMKIKMPFPLKVNMLGSLRVQLTDWM